MISDMFYGVTIGASPAGIALISKCPSVSLHYHNFRSTSTMLTHQNVKTETNGTYFLIKTKSVVLMHI